METLDRLRRLPLQSKASVTRELWIGVICAALSMAAFLGFAWTWWPGDPHHCAVVWEGGGPTSVDLVPHRCFCEAFEVADVRAQRAGVRQLANTWSNLLPLLTGLLLALASGYDRIHDRLRSSAPDATWGGQYPLIFVLVVGFMGPGSMFFHGSITQWGGWIDNLSMFLFVWFLLSYGVIVRSAWTRHPWRWFCGTFGLGVAGSMAILVFSDLYVDGKGLFLLWPAAVFALYEVVCILRGSPRTWWAAAAMASCALALGIWAGSVVVGGPLCRAEDAIFGPNSLIQAHAVWHALANLTAFFLFLHFRGTDTVS